MHHIHSECPRSITSGIDFVTTLVSQTTLDRLLLMKETCQRWKSPIIIVVCVTPEELNRKWKETQQEYSKVCPHMKLIPFQVRDEYEKKFKYPINVMRNKGLDEVATSHVLMIDADFIPNVDLDKAIQKAIQLVIEQDNKERITTNGNMIMNIGGSKGNASVAAKNQNHLYHHHALVVPAYEQMIASNKCQSNNLEACIQLLTLLDPEFMPRSMESLEKCVKGSAESQYIVDTSSASSLESTNNATTTAKKSKCIVFHRSDYF